MGLPPFTVIGVKREQTSGYEAFHTLCVTEVIGGKPMKMLKKTALVAAIAGITALPLSSAQAWWGGPGWGDGSGWGDGFGDMFGDFDMSVRGSGSGYGRGHGYGRGYGYGYPYGGYGWGGYPGYGGWGGPGYGGWGGPGYGGYPGYGGGWGGPGYGGAPYAAPPAQESGSK
jgi:hypothetical protein